MAFFEFVQDVSPGASGFNVREGKLTRVWDMAVTFPGEITDAIRLILGGTQYASTATGKLKRDLPRSDPQYPWLYASNIPNIVGMGMRQAGNPGAGGGGRFREAQTDDPGAGDGMISPSFGLYPHYRFTVESSPRPFVVAGDNRITTGLNQWFNFAGNAVPYSFVTEYNRYVDAVVTPTPQALQGQQGTMVFVSNLTPPHGAAFAGRPMMYLPNEALAVTWYQVPHRYISSQNSYIAGAQGNRPWFGCVNHRSITLCGVRYPPASLLYLGYSLSARYPRAVDVRANDPNLVAGDAAYGVEKFVDITFNFGVTWRTAPANSLPGPRDNPNFVVGGWNLLPYLPDRRFHYASSNPTAGGVNRTPAFLSFPIELLFMDPDVPQGFNVFNQ
jgi:hypothetical protein